MMTWDDVVIAAKGRPWTDEPPDRWRLDVTGAIFQQAVTMVERGELTREEVMIQIALHLAEVVQRQHDQIVDHLWNGIIPPIIVQPK